jgi:hypothetical protein
MFPIGIGNLKHGSEKFKAERISSTHLTFMTAIEVQRFNSNQESGE